MQLPPFHLLFTDLLLAYLKNIFALQIGLFAIF
jgi:hypothetical protein